MTILEFMGEHPILTMLVVWAVCNTIVRVAVVIAARGQIGKGDE